jgi:hypothetical protein
MIPLKVLTSVVVVFLADVVALALTSGRKNMDALARKFLLN